MKAKIEVHDVSYWCVVRHGGINGVVIHAMSPDKLAMKMLSRSVHGSWTEQYSSRDINKIVSP